jgi:hypothetical protein
VDIALALAAAFFFALGLVLQEKSASAQPAESVARGFLVRLAHEPIWLLGLAMQGVGFVAQAIALGIGRMVIVQPLLVATIVFALPLGRVIEKRPIKRTDMIGAALVTVGLGTLLIVSKTSAGEDDASLRSWAVIGGGAIAVAVLLFALARGRTSTVRAGMLGTAAGILFGLAAALTKTTVSMFDDGVGAVLWDWHVYALVIVSVAAFWLEQAALQTGALRRGPPRERSRLRHLLPVARHGARRSRDARTSESCGRSASVGAGSCTGLAFVRLRLQTLRLDANPVRRRGRGPRARDALPGRR